MTDLRCFQVTFISGMRNRVFIADVQITLHSKQYTLYSWSERVLHITAHQMLRNQTTFSQ